MLSTPEKNNVAAVVVSSSRPTNALVTPLLTDLYQITMVYGFWKNGRQDEPSIFELFFRKNPFRGEYTIFCGLDEVIKFIDSYKIAEDDIDYLKGQMKNCEDGFWDYLRNLDCSRVTISSMKEGTVAFPREPLIVVKGPLGIAQLLETTLLTLVNFPSLVATNAARMVLAASQSSANNPSFGVNKKKVPGCVEFGLRRAQGPDGGFSASKYSYLGGFDGTSNVLAGKLLGLPIVGTHAHSFVQSYVSLDEVKDKCKVLNKDTNQLDDLTTLVLKYRNEKGWVTTNDGELAAFIAYASAFPDKFLCLIDTYDTLMSGVLNFILVALVLGDLGYKPMGVRLDSGDLAYLSMECYKVFKEQSAALNSTSSSSSSNFFDSLDIVVSNDINEEVLHNLHNQHHAITNFGIGTNLVTCQAQPALGCVYKLVEIDGKPRMKLSQDIEKVLIPGRKRCFRIYGKDGRPLMDYMILGEEQPPKVGERFMVRHPFIENKRAAVVASRIAELHSNVFENGEKKITVSSLKESQKYVKEQLSSLRPDILRHVNPTPYKVAVSTKLFTFLHELWMETTPVAELN
mmetsp:Transcript_3942/g.4550  ORF Transcript_3942/g.4550 Transcript_3942/m.4550 type:complete len:571 (-) Transcript_3942:73-1785(-)